MVELLAPAGDMDCFKAALAAGADAIYVGGKKYGARAYAGNFEQEDLLSAIDLAHLWDKKVYLTVNTLVKETELNELGTYLRPYYEQGIDAVIVQDFGALSRIRKLFPDLEIHASTQMTLTGAYGANLLKELGVSRIVPARELSLKEIKYIKDITGLEIETFIHGAMCYGYSGQCLFSSMLGERSGNRGRCAGPCRLPYEVWYKGKKLNAKNEAYQLSLKDLCTLEIIPDLIEAGIDSFKMEGRMKTPQYVSFVTGMYRKYIDLYQENPKQFSVSKEDIDLISKRFSRGSIRTGYYYIHNARDLVTLDKPGYRSFDIDDKEEAKLELAANPQILLEGIFGAKIGEKLSLTIWKSGDTDAVVTILGETVEQAKNCATAKEEVYKQLTKTGNTPFSFESLTLEMEDNLFLPKKSLNDLRRQALAMLSQRLLSKQKRETNYACQTEEKPADKKREMPLKEIDKYLHIDVTTIEQFLAVEKYDSLKRVYLSFDAIILSVKNDKLIRRIIDKREALIKDGIEVVLKFPAVCRQKTMKCIMDARTLIESFAPDAFCVGNLEILQYLKTEYPQIKLVSDAGLYLFNGETALFYQKYGIREHICSYELHRKEILELLSLKETTEHSFYLPVYGYIPVMESAGCLLKTNGMCQKGQGEEALVLVDRHRQKRTVVTHCQRCENTIYNSVPLSLHKELGRLRDMGLSGILLRFTTENVSQMKDTIHCFMDLYENGESPKTDLPEYDFTKGHFVKGVE